MSSYDWAVVLSKHVSCVVAILKQVYISLNAIGNAYIMYIYITQCKYIINYTSNCLMFCILLHIRYLYVHMIRTDNTFHIQYVVLKPKNTVPQYHSPS